MKKISALVMVLIISLSFISCSDSGSSSSLTDQERMAILSAAFTGASTGVAGANSKAVYSSPDGSVTVSGDFAALSTNNYSIVITFNNYSDSNVTLNGSITFSLAGGTNYLMSGKITAVYQGESYSFGMNITGTGADSMTGTITVDGTVYNL